MSKFWVQVTLSVCMYVWQHLCCYGHFCFDVMNSKNFYSICPTYWKTNTFMELFLNVSYWNISIFYLPEVCFDRVKFLEVAYSVC